MKRNTLVVNLFGGPGLGKSTGATYIFSKLKMAGVNAEYVSEFAKDRVWEHNKKAFNNQMYVTGNQSFRLSRCVGEVDVIVTDSPILLGSVYTEPNNVALKEAIKYEFDKYNNFNVLLIRKKEYNPNGRNQTEEEAKEIDKQILDLFKNNNVNHIEVPGSLEGYDSVVSIVLDKLKDGKQSI